MSDDPRSADVRRRLLQPGSVEDVLGTLPILDELAAAHATAKAGEEVEGGFRRAFECLRELTAAEPDRATEILTGDLLPRCLVPDRGNDDSFGNRHCYTLGEWLADLPEAHRHRVRAAALPQALAALDGAGVRNAIRLVSCVGYWDGDVLEALDRLARGRADEAGDHALAALVSLRSDLDPAVRAAYLEMLHRRIPAGPNLHQLICARIIGTPETAGRVWSHWLATPSARTEPRGFFAAMARSLLTEIAARLRDPGLTARVWDWLVELSRRSTDGLDDVFSSNSTLVNRLDLPAVVPELVRLAACVEGHHRYLYYLRVLECECPAHMAGWNAVPLAELTAVRTDAVGPTGMKGRFSTIELHQKEAAWNVLLCRGEPSALPPFGDALDGESGRVAHRFLELASCLRLAPLPAAVGTLLADAGNNGWDEDERLVAQIGAIEAAHGASTREAFDALLGYRQIGGGVLLSAVAALAETARRAAEGGDRALVERLLQIAETSPREDSRGAAAAAVAGLLEDGALTAVEMARAAGLLSTPTTDRYAVRELLFALATRPPGDVPPEAVSHARTLLDVVPTDRNADPRPAALSLVARQPGSRSDPHFLTQYVGLTVHPDAIAASPLAQFGAAPHVVGRYFAAEPERFGPAVASLLRDGDTNTIANLIPFIVRAGATPPAVVVDALVARVRKADSGRVADSPLLHALAAVAPGRLLADGCHHVANWLPQARADLADALGGLGALPEGLASARFEQLTRLAGDGVYAVRRSAYRAATACAPDWLVNLAMSWAQWSKPGREGPRRYAAECAGWLPAKVETEHFASLGWDQEPGVRKAYQRSLGERAERLAAAEFEARVLGVHDPAGVVPNWRHGIALALVGDDSTLRRLAERIGEGLPPAVRFWLKRVRKAVERRWGEVTRKWPEPWYARPGHLESFTGTIRGEDGKEARLTGTLWLLPPEAPGGRGDWGGWATSEKRWTGSGELAIPGRRRAQLLMASSIIPAHELTFWGNGPYPEVGTDLT